MCLKLIIHTLGMLQILLTIACLARKYVRINLLTFNLILRIMNFLPLKHIYLKVYLATRSP